jgi:hypothetical protein
MTYKGDSCHGGTKSKQRVTVLLGFNADGTEKLPPLVTGTYNKPGCFRKVKNSPLNSNSWMTLATFEEFLVQLDHQTGAKNRKFLLFIDQWAAYPRDTTALKNIEVIFFPQIAHAICSHWIWGSSTVSNASTEGNSYVRQ